MDKIAYADGPSVGKTSDRPQTHLESAVSRLADLTGNARTIESMLADMHARAFGPSPEAGNAGVKVREARVGVHGDLSDRLDDIDACLHRILDRISSLSSFV